MNRRGAPSVGEDGLVRREEQAPDELTETLEYYLSEVEAGRPVDPERLITEHPHIADSLRACLESLQLVEQAVGPLSASGPPGQAAPAEAAKGQLGDYRIVREIGRGGMGIVYEAEQISLERRVALKVLPFAAVLDTKPKAKATHSLGNSLQSSRDGIERDSQGERVRGKKVRRCFGIRLHDRPAIGERYTRSAVCFEGGDGVCYFAAVDRAEISR